MGFAQTESILQNNTFFWSSGVFMVMLVVILVVAAIIIIADWKIFEKAGEAGWKSIVPFYSVYILCRIAGRNGWLFLAFFVPFVNIVVQVILSLDLARHFGKSDAFGILGLYLFAPIGYVMLGFGDAKYVGTKHK